MANELRHRYEDDARPNAFTLDEKQKIIDAFDATHYYRFVRSEVTL
jgi:hypothetical protein